MKLLVAGPPSKHNCTSPTTILFDSCPCSCLYLFVSICICICICIRICILHFGFTFTLVFTFALHLICLYLYGTLHLYFIRIHIVANSASSDLFDTPQCSQGCPSYPFGATPEASFGHTECTCKAQCLKSPLGANGFLNGPKVLSTNSVEKHANQRQKHEKIALAALAKKVLCNS